MHLLVVEDQCLLRDLILAACHGLPPFTTVTAAGDATSALAIVAQHGPDVVALSLHLPDRDAFDLARHIRRARPQTRFVALCPTLFRPPDHTFQGWIHTREDPSLHLQEALIRVAGGRSYVSPALRRARRLLGGDPSAPYKLLSPREWDLLPLFARGLSNTEVADLVRLSPHTAQVHRRNIMRKLGLHSTPQLIYFALHRGLLRIPH